jgi:hypothetical protein
MHVDAAAALAAGARRAKLDAAFSSQILDLAVAYADERSISFAEACRIAAGILTTRARLLDRIASQAASAQG